MSTNERWLGQPVHQSVIPKSEDHFELLAASASVSVSGTLCERVGVLRASFSPGFWSPFP
jgi:hypothetical protein